RIAGDISFAAWVRCDDIGRDAPIMAKEGDGHLSYWFGTFGLPGEGGGPGDFGVLLDADGNQPWSLYNRDQGLIPQGQWVHLTSVRAGSTVTHYINGQPLAHTGTFAGPIHISDAFLAIGVNSLYNFTAFKGAIDEVYLYNYALTPANVRALYANSILRFTSTAVEGNDLRLTWHCDPGQSYELQTNANLATGGAGFAPLASPLVVPADYNNPTTNYLHIGALTNGQALYYRLKQLP
ncbi:MAG: LamG domain-containing protein, partial [Verrucomicrobiota bacterium]